MTKNQLSARLQVVAKTELGEHASVTLDSEGFLILNWRGAPRDCIGYARPRDLAALARVVREQCGYLSQQMVRTAPKPVDVAKENAMLNRFAQQFMPRGK